MVAPQQRICLSSKLPRYEDEQLFTASATTEASQPERRDRTIVRIEQELEARCFRGAIADRGAACEGWRDAVAGCFRRLVVSFRQATIRWISPG